MPSTRTSTPEPHAPGLNVQCAWDVNSPNQHLSVTDSAALNLNLIGCFGMLHSPPIIAGHYTHLSDTFSTVNGILTT